MVEITSPLGLPGLTGIPPYGKILFRRETERKLHEPPGSPGIAPTPGFPQIGSTARPPRRGGRTTANRFPSAWSATKGGCILTVSTQHPGSHGMHTNHATGGNTKMDDTEVIPAVTPETAEIVLDFNELLDQPRDWSRRTQKTLARPVRTGEAPQAGSLPLPLLPTPRGSLDMVDDHPDALAASKEPRWTQEQIGEFLWKLVIVLLIVLTGMLTWFSEAGTTIRRELSSPPPVVAPTEVPITPPPGTARPAAPGTEQEAVVRPKSATTTKRARVAIPTQHATSKPQGKKARKPLSSVPTHHAPTKTPVSKVSPDAPVKKAPEIKPPLVDGGGEGDQTDQEDQTNQGDQTNGEGDGEDSKPDSLGGTPVDPDDPNVTIELPDS